VLAHRRAPLSNLKTSFDFSSSSVVQSPLHATRKLAPVRAFLCDQQEIPKHLGAGPADGVLRRVQDGHTRNWDGKIKGRGTAAWPTDCLHMGFRSTQQEGLRAASALTG
jgi:hypothetical protein